MPKWACFLCTFGEVGIVKSTPAIQSKLENKGRPCVFVGYPTHNNAGNVYRFFTLDKQSIVHSRDVQVMNQMLRQYAKHANQPANADGDDESYMNPYSVLQDSDGNSPENTTTTPPTLTRLTRSGRAITTSSPTTSQMNQELRGLHTYYNPILDCTNQDNQVQIEDNTEPEGQGVLSFQSLLSFRSCLARWTLRGSMTPILPLIPQNVKAGEAEYQRSLPT